MSRYLPIAVYLTGLPDFTGARTGATFARRFKTTTLSAIDDDDLASALQPFVFDGWEVPDDIGGVIRVYMEPNAVAATRQLNGCMLPRPRCPALRPWDATDTYRNQAATL